MAVVSRGKNGLLLAIISRSLSIGFELGNEIKDVRKALRVKIIGMETISGRKATKLELPRWWSFIFSMG